MRIVVLLGPGVFFSAVSLPASAQWRNLPRALQGSVTLSGRVTDYEGHPLDSVSVFWQGPDFKDIEEVITNSNGYYSARIKKGKYQSVGALNMSEYPLYRSKLSPEDQRLEFWAWNFIADRDTTFNMRYHRMEAYGINVFRVQGATPGYTIYVRPMSLTRVLEYNKNKTAEAILAPGPDSLGVEVTINGESVPVRMKQEIKEYFAPGEWGNAYLLFVDLPKQKSNLPYSVFRIELTDLANGDRGEGVYFLEKQNYITAPRSGEE